MSWSDVDAGRQAIFARSFTAGGLANELAPSIIHAAGDATALSAASLLGDRIVTVYQDSTLGGDQSNVGVRILDTRTDANGLEIAIGAVGVTLLGDPAGGGGGGNAAPDVLVGTVGNDRIDGFLDADILDGALGNDRIFAGGGDDVIDGGGNGAVSVAGGILSDGTALAAGGDTVVFTGRFSNDGDNANDDYSITHLGNNIFQVADLRPGSPDGTDFIRNVEWFEFLGNAPDAVRFPTSALSALAPDINPSAWGWTDADADLAPNAAGTPDIDGFIVNHADASLVGIQSNPFVADSVGEFFGVVWETAVAPGADTHIRGQFYDVIGAFDSFIPNAINISDGIGIETNPVITSGGANSGWGVAFEQWNEAADLTRSLRTNFVGPGQLTSVELEVLDEGNSVDQHDAAMFGSFLDRIIKVDAQGVAILVDAAGNEYAVEAVSGHLKTVATATTPSTAVVDANGLPVAFNGVFDDAGNPIVFSVDGATQTPVAVDGSGHPILFVADALGAPSGSPIVVAATTVVTLPTGMDEGYNIAWISTAADAADSDYGRVMFQRFEVPLDALGNPGAPVAGGIDGIDGFKSDAAVQLAVSGRNPSTSALHTFETAVIWIEQNGAGGERVAGVFIDDLGNIIPDTTTANISGDYEVAPGTVAHVVSAGAVNFGVVWVTPSSVSPSGLTVMATMYSSAGAGLNGQGFGLGASAIFSLFDLPAGSDPANLQFSASGLSGEDSNDLVVSWRTTSVAGDAEMMARHIAVTLDPVTGIALAMAPEGASIVVNATSVGDQDQGNIAGMLGDRFLAVYRDTNGTYTDGSDIVARIIDTRDAANPEPIIGDFVRAGVVQARRDVLVGTNGNDNIRGDISEADGRVDYIYAGMGDDIIQGGPGVRGAGASPEIIDGGEGSDTSVYTGRLQDYSITINGDGSYEVIDLRQTADANGILLPHDGIDNLYSIERIRFLDLENGGAGAQTIAFGFPGIPPAPLAGWDGTPTPWSLADDPANPNKEIAVDHSAGDQSGIAVTNLQDGAGLAWIVGTNQVWAISYDATGNPDPILLGVNTQLTSSVYAGNMVSDIDVAMTGGLGMTTVWESANGADSAIHLAFASTNTHVVLDTAGGVPGPGLPGGEIVVIGSDGAGTSVDPVIQGYEIVNSANDTLEVGFHVGYVLQNDGLLDASAGDAWGALLLARYEIPVYDILVDAAGLPVLNAGQGQLATDAAGNRVPSTAATFGVGSETDPVSIGLDGLRGTADDNAAIIITEAGLFAANDPLVGTDAAHAPIQGRDLSIGSLHDGQLVVTYIGADEQVHLHVYIPKVNETADRETAGLGGVDVVATGVTAYAEFALPFATTLGTVAAGHTAITAPQQNGSFGVFWAASVSGSIDIQGIIYSGAGTNWSPTQVLTFASGLPANVAFQVAPTGVTPGGLEDGFFVSWEAGAGIAGQRFDMTGALVGSQIVAGDPINTPGAHAVAGIDDGRMLVGYQDGSDVSAQFLDNRQPGVALIGPRTGAPADVIVGTVGNDAIDGRALNDQLFGGLGDDLITMGSGADIGFGGAGNDTLIGGTGQDQLLGEAGDDVLWGGLSGPIDPQVDRVLQAGLTAAGVSATLLATDPGADVISGGAGNDTISFQGEFGDFNVDLQSGIVTSDRRQNGNFILEDVIGEITADGAGGLILQFTNDVENATGGIGNDTLTGNAGDNILTGGPGTNVIDGGAGADTVVLSGNFADFAIGFSAATQAFTFSRAATATAPASVDIVSSVETFLFADGARTLADLMPGPVAVADTMTGDEDTLITLDLIGNDLNAATSTLTAINGVAISIGSPVIVANGVVSLSASGLTFLPAADFFGPITFNYTIGDNAGRSSTADVSLTVVNVNDAPTNILFNSADLGKVSVAEGAATGTLVASLATVDPDITDTFTYTLADTFGGTFQIVGSTIRVTSGAVLDFEGGPASYSLNVTTNDGHGGTRTESLVVAVSDINEAPTDIRLNNSPTATVATITELSAANTVVASLSAIDPDLGINGAGGVAFGLTNSADGRFAIVGNQIMLANPSLVDFEDPNNPAHSYTLQVSARDAAGLVRLETFTVQVTDAAAGVETVNLGTAGANTMTGGGGANTYFVNNGGDRITDTGGVDTVYVSAITSYTLPAAMENLIYTGTANGTSWSGNGSNNTMAGGAGNDQIQGNAGNDHLVGNGGADTMQGGNGEDRLYGGIGNDTMSGGAGNDYLEGGLGNDTLNGGGGNDVHAYLGAFGADRIQGFGDTAGDQDIIEFSSSVFSSYSAVLANMRQVGRNVVITEVASGSTLTIESVTLANIGADDFRFF